MTYPDVQVSAILNQAFVPVQVDIDKAGELRQRYHVMWTPNLHVLDRSGATVRQLEGYLPPGELVPELILGVGRFDLREEHWDDAARRFDEVADRYPTSHGAPEGLYFAAVASYKGSHEVKRLIDGWQVLKARYPESIWSVRTYLKLPE